VRRNVAKQIGTEKSSPVNARPHRYKPDVREIVVQRDSSKEDPDFMQGFQHENLSPLDRNLQFSNTLHQEVIGPTSPGQRNMISTPLSPPHLDDRDERNATQRDNEGHIRQLGGRAQTNAGYRTRKGS